MPTQWESHFPHLGRWTETSKATDSYNCTAFAASDSNRWWDPIPGDIYYWPDDVPRSYSLASYVALFQSLGYEACEDTWFDPYHDKIIIYTNEYGIFEHVARQLPDGNWTSKIGGSEDIMHESPASLAGDEYGQPTTVMQRPIKLKG